MDILNTQTNSTMKIANSELINKNTIEQNTLIQSGKKRSIKSIEKRSNLITLISKILEIEELPPTKSAFKFENTIQAANHNKKILKSFNFDYEKLLEKQRNTNISYGSEFRNYKNLEELLKHHTSWNELKTFLTSGTDTVLKEMKSEELKNDCMENMRRGNHKSANKSKEILDFVI